MADQFTIVHSGNEYFSKLHELINTAKSSIRILVYSLNDDETGTEVINHLKQAADRKISVELLVDSFGSKDLSSVAAQDIYNAGIRFRKFSSHLTGNVYSLGRRLHAKMILVDDEKILIGGINLSNNYSDISGKAWLDYAVYFESAKVGADLAGLHELIFNKKLSKRVYASLSFRDTQFKVLVNDWLYRSNSISKATNEFVENCKEELVIMSSYFLPGVRFLKKLANASKRGVKVTVINSENWDIPFMKYAIRYLYPWMVRNGIQLYEWKPTVLHAKVLLADQRICSLGSYNLNALSQFNSLEMNVVIAEPTFISNLRAEIDALIQDESKVAKIDTYQPNWPQKMINWLSYRVVRTSLNLMFFLVKEEQNRRNLTQD